MYRLCVHLCMCVLYLRRSETTRRMCGYDPPATAARRRLIKDDAAMIDVYLVNLRD